MRLLSDLKEQAAAWRGVEARVGEMTELLELATAESDDDLAGAVAADTAKLAGELEGMELELAFSGEYDRRPAIMAIHAGAGGTDAQDWAEMLLRMYLRWADKHKYEANVLDIMPGEEAGIKSATVEIVGRNAYGNLRAERGVHRLVRISPYDASKSRHTAFTLVEVLPEVESETEVEINPDELRIDTYNAGGAGGQNVQKNDNAVRITHIPTGIVATCQDERSQLKNKNKALAVLQSRLLERELAKQAEEQAKLKGVHVSAGWGNQIRSYVLHPYKMVKDLRTQYETSDAEGVLDGNIDELLRAYQKATIGA